MRSMVEGAGTKRQNQPASRQCTADSSAVFVFWLTDVTIRDGGSSCDRDPSEGLDRTTKMHTLFLQHRTRPGARAQVQDVWNKHMRPAVAANPGHLAYIYAFGSDEDRICAFQVYESAEEAQAFLRSDAYVAYELEVSPLLYGPPQVEVLQAQWVKGLS